MIYGYADESVGLAAGRLAVRIVNDLVRHDAEFDFDAEFEQFLVHAERTAFGPSTQALVDEAVSRDIPWMRLNSASLVQLGQGCYAQRIRATMTSNTSALATDIASDKDMTNKLLSAAGLPTPRSDSVRTLRGALHAARRIGYPVVIKPLDGNHGRGVVLNITDDSALEAGYDVAKAESRSGYLQVESFITGNDYRFLVVGGRIAAVAERVPAHVIGDGEHTVTELVELTNADPRRGVGHEKVLTRIRVDDAAVALVAAQGLAMDEVPDDGPDGQAGAHRQHVDRWHLHRPDHRRAPGQHRDRRGGRSGGRARRGRHRLHRPGHHGARPRGRRCHLRGQRGTGLPDAHPPDDR